MENKIKHLELIQSIITRMSTNSFSLKGWAVTLVSGIFALANKDTDKTYILVSYIPIIIFWGLDAYYLYQERLYRELYEKVRNQNSEEILFSLTPNIDSPNNSWYKSLISKTEVSFYLSLALTPILIIFLSIIFS